MTTLTLNLKHATDMSKTIKPNKSGKRKYLDCSDIMEMFGEHIPSDILKLSHRSISLGRYLAKKYRKKYKNKSGPKRKSEIHNSNRW